MENTSTTENTLPRTPLQEQFAYRISDCFLAALDRIAEDESENDDSGENQEVTTDQIIARLFADEEYLSTLIGEAVEEFESRYAQYPPPVIEPASP